MVVKSDARKWENVGRKKIPMSISMLDELRKLCAILMVLEDSISKKTMAILGK